MASKNEGIEEENGAEAPPSYGDVAAWKASMIADGMDVSEYTSGTVLVSGQIFSRM
jgi:hypothetical protein